MGRTTSRINRFLDRNGWLRRKLGGHIKLGRLTIYGRNAMHYAWNYQRKDGMYVCFRPPSRCFGMKLGYYFYISPDGTPSDAVYYRPKKHWWIEEPNDPAYHKAVWMDKVIQHDIENGDRWSRASNFTIKPKKQYLKRLEADYIKHTQGNDLTTTDNQSAGEGHLESPNPAQYKLKEKD